MDFTIKIKPMAQGKKGRHSKRQFKQEKNLRISAKPPQYLREEKKYGPSV